MRRRCYPPAPVTQGRRRNRELSRRELHRGSVGTFGLHEVELSTGRRVTLELLRHPGAAAVVPFLDAERILLLRQ
jgi:ADP-ribose pyrophosphatase